MTAISRPSPGKHHAGVADLAAGLGIEGRLVGENGDLSAGVGFFDLLAVRDDGDDLPLGDRRGVAQELARAVALAEVEPDRFVRRLAGPGPALARLGALPLHRGVEPRGIDRPALSAQDVLRQIEGEAVGVIELERDLAGQRLLVAELRRLLFEQAQTAAQHALEPRLLVAKRLGDQRARPAELGIGLAHLALQRGHQLPQQRLVAPHHMRVAHGAPHDAAEDVSAALVRRQDAIGDQKARRPQMVGDHPMRHRVIAVRRGARCIRRRLDQGAHLVGVVVVVEAL